jgi:hypothetical protein
VRPSVSVEILVGTAQPVALWMTIQRRAWKRVGGRIWWWLEDPGSRGLAQG